MKNVTLKQLRAFVTVAHERSFTRAAGRLNISQSALTLGIRELEAELALRLFDRSTRSVQPTTQAEVFLPVAIRLLDELDHAVDDLRAVAGRRKGSVVVSANASFINVVLVPAVAAIARDHPGISVRIMEDAAEKMFQSVLEGAADFGVSAIWRPTDALKARLLLKDRLGVLCPAGHPLARGKGPVAWAKVAPHQIVALPKGTGIRSMMDHQPKIAKFLPPPMYEVSSVAAMVSLARHGVGVAILPGIAFQFGVPAGLVFRPLKTPSLIRELHFISSARRALSPAAEQLSKIMFNEVRKLAKSNYLTVSGAFFKETDKR